MKSSSSKNTENGHNNQLTSEKGEELVERIPIAETPFTAIRIENKWFLTMGKYRLTDPVDSFELIQIEAENTTWDRILQVVKIVLTDELEQREKIAQAKMTQLNNQ